MSLTSGTRLGVYEITAQIGEGGMGQVYRARDTQLNRDVALKVLPEAFAGDADRLARFTREAQVLASLNHPHIAAIYGIEGDALVMELVEGEDLSQRIARGAIPIDEALPIAKQIAEALEAAHEQGIIHRDLKPANIKLRTDGTVKVLDFGLAKAMEPGGIGGPGSAQLANSPTITTPAMTQMGMILGTAAYMAPEQAKGRVVDRRADIWAFGAVLFEMLTGTRAFPGEDLTDTLAAVVRAEPNWALLPAGLPAAVVVYLRRCLNKDPRQRAQAIGDVRLALEGAFETAAPQTTASATALASRGRLPWMVALAAMAAVAIALTLPAVRHLRETPPPAPPETRLDIVTPATTRPADFALSPDGRQIVFVALGDGAQRLWLRSLATTAAQPLAGTEGAGLPFWAPDGRSIGFFTSTALMRLDLSGGLPQTLAPALVGGGGTWSADGVIVFAPNTIGPLSRVSATGGTALVITTLGPQRGGHSRPSFLPDGRRFLFSVGGERDTDGIYLGALDGSAATRLTPGDRPVYLSPGPGSAEASREGGWLLWMRAGTLTAQRLDAERAALVGEPVTVTDGVSGVSVAATGLVAYRPAVNGQRQLNWVDRAGAVQGTVGISDNSLQNPRVSPDGRRVVVDRTVQGNRDLWLLDGARTSRFTFDAAADNRAMWSPDGSRIVFASGRTGAVDLYQKLASGAGAEERLVASDELKNPTSWSADGRFLLYHSTNQQSNIDLWVVPMLGDRTPFVFLRTPFREVYGAFSPDGRWVAYHSNESGRNEIYVRPFVPPAPEASADKLASSREASADKSGGQWQVSTAGGVFPTWRPDGKELYYLNPAGAMMVAPVTSTATSFEPGAPVVLFPTRILGGGADSQQGRQYDVTRDGRFLINTVLDEAAAPITLLMNWNPEAKK